MTARFGLAARQWRSAVLIVLCALALTAASRPVLAVEGVAHIVRKIKPSVVTITAYDAAGNETSQASGFFVSRTGEVVTNRHVIEGSDHASVKTNDGRTISVESLLAESLEADLVRLKLFPEGGGLAEKSKSSRLEKRASGHRRSKTLAADPIRFLSVRATAVEEGERVVVIGSPLGYEGTVSDGIVSAVREVPGFGRIVQVTAPISDGSSGSPVVNMKGEVVGIATMRSVRGQNLNFAIPADRIARLKSGRPKTLAEWSADGRKRWPSSAEGLYGDGLQHLWQGDYAIALALFEKAVELAPATAEIHFEIGICRATLGNDEGALAAFRRAIEIRPDFAMAHYNFAVSLDTLGRFEEGEKSYTEAIRYDPALSRAETNRGIDLSRLGRYEEAIELFEKVTRKDSNDNYAWYNLGVVYSLQQRSVEAIEIYRKVIRNDPKMTRGYLNLGTELEQLGRHEEAIAIFEKLIRIDPASVSGHNNLGSSFLSLGRYWDAIASFGEALRLAPGDFSAHYDLGLAWEGLRRWADAVDTYRSAIQIGPNQSSAHYRLAIALAKAGDREGALEELGSVQRLAPELVGDLEKAIGK